MYTSQIINHTADVGFTIEAATVNELFEGAAILTFEVMTDLKKIKPISIKTVEIESETIEKLLFDFIDELIFLKDAEYMLFSEFHIEVTEQKKGKATLKAELVGEEINPKKHELKVDVKAVTLHHFYLKKEQGKYKASIILDI